jgi:hypothetical protein
MNPKNWSYKEVVKLPIVILRYKTELKQNYFKKKIQGTQSKDVCDCKGTMTGYISSC